MFTRGYISMKSHEIPWNPINLHHFQANLKKINLSASWLVGRSHQALQRVPGHVAHQGAMAGAEVPHFLGRKSWAKNRGIQGKPRFSREIIGGLVQLEFHCQVEVPEAHGKKKLWYQWEKPWIDRNRELSSATLAQWFGNPWNPETNWWEQIKPAHNSQRWSFFCAESSNLCLNRRHIRQFQCLDHIQLFLGYMDMLLQTDHDSEIQNLMIAT